MSILSKFRERSVEKKRIKQESKEKEERNYEIVKSAFIRTYNNRTTLELACSNCGWKGLAASTVIHGTDFRGYVNEVSTRLYNFNEFNKSISVHYWALFCPRCSKIVKDFDKEEIT